MCRALFARRSRSFFGWSYVPTREKDFFFCNQSFPLGGENQMPSNAILEKKQKAVADLAEQIKASAAGVIVNYQGITVENDTVMRKALREAGVTYTVVKNTMTGRACDMCGYSELKPELNGMTAIAISPTDPIVAAKILKQYDEKIESFKILAGYVDGKVIDAAGVMELADIPSKEVMLAKILGSIQAPLYNLAYGLKAVAEKMEEAPAEEAAPAAEEAAPAAEEAAPAAEEAPAEA